MSDSTPAVDTKTWYEYIEAVQAIIKRGTDIHEATMIRRYYTDGKPALEAAEAILGNPQLLGG
jgi:hypothetical protein